MEESFLDWLSAHPGKDYEDYLNRNIGQNNGQKAQNNRPTSAPQTTPITPNIATPVANNGSVLKQEKPVINTFSRRFFTLVKENEIILTRNLFAKNGERLKVREGAFFINLLPWREVTKMSIKKYFPYKDRVYKVLGGIDEIKINFDLDIEIVDPIKYILKSDTASTVEKKIEDKFNSIVSNYFNSLTEEELGINTTDDSKTKNVIDISKRKNESDFAKDILTLLTKEELIGEDAEDKSTKESRVIKTLETLYGIRIVSLTAKDFLQPKIVREESQQSRQLMFDKAQQEIKNQMNVSQANANAQAAQVLNDVEVKKEQDLSKIEVDKNERLSAIRVAEEKQQLENMVNIGANPDTAVQRNANITNINLNGKNLEALNSLREALTGMQATQGSTEKMQENKEVLEKIRAVQETLAKMQANPVTAQKMQENKEVLAKMQAIQETLAKIQATQGTTEKIQVKEVLAKLQAIQETLAKMHSNQATLEEQQNNKNKVTSEKQQDNQGIRVTVRRIK